MNTRQTFLLGAILGIGIGVVWMIVHYSCPTCQNKTAYFKRILGRFALRIIE